MGIDMPFDWALAVSAIGLVLAIWASVHAALTKRDVRAASGWVAISILVPVLGPIGYYLLGINRIQRRAVRLRRRRADAPAHEAQARNNARDGAVAAIADNLVPLRALGDRIASHPLTRGNRVEPLDSGDATYAAMEQAIDGAEHTIGLATYIFDDDRAGARIAGALARALRRGVAVRVLVDGVGVHYSRPPVTRRLEAAGVPTGWFLPPRLVPWRMPYANMRNHRKIMVVDGRIGFTGGMNIREGFTTGEDGKPGQRDTHFRVEGPVVGHLSESFVQDWAFTTGEVLDDALWLPDLHPAKGGTALARGIASGPDRAFEANQTVILGALSVAQRRVAILTPYFIPDRTLVSALGIAARRGVRVDIVLPSQSNLRLIQWAARSQIPQVLEPGCFVWRSAPPFDHSKLLVVDGTWAFIGSSNWDARSLRLNFEFDLEIYDKELAEALEARIDGVIETSTPQLLADLRRRPLLVRVRDAAVWLFAPYL